MIASDCGVLGVFGGMGRIVRDHGFGAYWQVWGGMGHIGKYCGRLKVIASDCGAWGVYGGVWVYWEVFGVNAGDCVVWGVLGGMGGYGEYRGVLEVLAGDCGRLRLIARYGAYWEGIGGDCR